MRLLHDPSQLQSQWNFLEEEESTSCCGEGIEIGTENQMAFLRGEPLSAKLAALAKYGVLPGAMVAALVYSPPQYGNSKDVKIPK